MSEGPSSLNALLLAEKGRREPKGERLPSMCFSMKHYEENGSNDFNGLDRFLPEVRAPHGLLDRFFAHRTVYRISVSRTARFTGSP